MHALSASADHRLKLHHVQQVYAMVCMMASKLSPTMLRRQLGAELRRLRDRTGRTGAAVAGELGWSESKLSRIETAAIGIRNPDLQRLLDLYRVSGKERSRLLALAVQSRQKAWWEGYGDALTDPYEAYIGFEAEASLISNYEALVVPGLLQTAEYAKAVTQADGLYDDPEILQQRIAVRMARQAVLAREQPPKLRAILDEAVLRRPIGGADVMRRQLRRLLEASEQPMITIQVLPFSVGAHRALAGSFIVLEFASGPDEALVYSEGMTGGVLRSKSDELSGYLSSFDSLRAQALTPEDSVEFISGIADGRR